MSSTYVSLISLLPVYPPNTTALWLSILVKVWQSSGGGASPVVACSSHTSARTVTEMCESEETTGSCGTLQKYYSIYGYGDVWVWSYHTVTPDSHTGVHINDWKVTYTSTGEEVNIPQYI